MITGSIKTHEEPEKTYSTRNQDRGWNWMYESWQQDNLLDPTNWKERDERILKVINEGTIAGFIQGARVKRSSGNPGYGTIIKINRTWTMAWNDTNQQLEPFKVCWDKTGPHSGGTFDYSADDLTLVKNEKEVPVLFLLPTKENSNEAVPGAC